MAFTVKITYKGIETDASRIVASISPIFVPTNSYIDTPAYVEGYHNSVTGGTIADKYGKSIYANNVDDKWGYANQVAPFDSTSIPFPVPLAQFKLAVVGKDNTVTFKVDDYKEAFYYMDLGKQLADQGFVVEVTDDDAPVVEVTVKSVAVVDGTDGVTPVTTPALNQKLLANITINDGTKDKVIGGYPVDPNAVYEWIKGDDTSVGSEPYFTVTEDSKGAKLTCKVSYKGATGTATWTGTVASK